MQSRQSLVQRLDRYYTDHRPLLDQVVSVIEEEVLPGVLKSSLAGFFEYTSTAPFWDDQPLACEVLIDVLSDRGFKVSHRTEVVVSGDGGVVIMIIMMINYSGYGDDVMGG